MAACQPNYAAATIVAINIALTLAGIALGMISVCLGHHFSLPHLFMCHFLVLWVGDIQGIAALNGMIQAFRRHHNDQHAADGVVPEIMPAGRSRMGLRELSTESMQLMLIILLAQCVAQNDGRWTSVQYCLMQLDFYFDCVEHHKRLTIFTG